MATYSRSKLISGLVDVLKALPALKGMQVEAFPEDPKDFAAKHLKSPKGAVLVAYEGMRRVREAEVEPERQVALDVVVIPPLRGGTPLDTLGAIEEAVDGNRLRTDDSRGWDMVYLGDAFDEHEKTQTVFYIARIACDLV